VGTQESKGSKIQEPQARLAVWVILLTSRAEGLPDVANVEGTIIDWDVKKKKKDSREAKTGSSKEAKGIKPRGDVRIVKKV